MRRTMLALLVMGVCQAAFAVEPGAVAGSALAPGVVAAAGLEGAQPGPAAANCAVQPTTDSALQAFQDLAAAPAVKCSTTVCSAELRCCVPYGCIVGRCVID